ncbi:MAG: glycosyltransferase [Candidatus Aminicenantes bacterium]|nr:MAG: glycosyltransferase [Candidatus Aminicenantes bacterium]
MKEDCDISVVTPSYNMLTYLKRCAASIADQGEGIFEHIVVDGVSTDGSVEWLAKQGHIRCISEKDNGMYDAINKGLQLAKGKILAYLNCDEQYLPGTLTFVTDYFEKNPQVDMIFGDLLLIRPDGSLVAYRKGYQPRWYYIVTSHLYVLSCTMFFRRRVIEEGFFFDTRFRTAGDADFVVRVLQGGFHARHIKYYLAAFTMTGKNLSTDPGAIAERKQLLHRAPFLVKKSKWLLNAVRLTEKFSSGAYFQKKPLEYSVYVINPGNMENQRKTFSVKKASSRWKFQ